MRTLFKAALAFLLTTGLSFSVLANQVDELLAKIDEDINAKRLSTPADNNAIEKIWRFKDLAPYDQRINDRVQRVGSVYVDLANRAIAQKRFSKAQAYLDNAWSISFLTPGLESSQDKLDGIFDGSSVAKKSAPKPKAVAKAAPKPKAVAKAAPKKTTVPPKQNRQSVKKNWLQHA